MLYDHETISPAAARRALDLARGSAHALPRMGCEILLFRYGAPCADHFGCEGHVYLRNESGTFGIVHVHTLPTPMM